MTAPQWLYRPEIMALLNLLVDKLDKAEEKDRSIQSIKLDVLSFPALFNAELEADKENCWSQLEQLQAWGWVRIKTDRSQQGKAGYELNPRLQITDVVAVRKATSRPETIRSGHQLWREAVFDLLKADSEVMDCIANQKLEIPGKSAEEIVERLNLLAELANKPLLLREVSARLFWGQSKVLDNRQSLINTILKVEECPFSESPI
jgi:hypothetical protein